MTDNVTDMNLRPIKTWLRNRAVLVTSQVLGRRVVFADDGVDIPHKWREAVVFRPQELLTIIGQHRGGNGQPITVKELKHIYKVKRTFNPTEHMRKQAIADAKVAAQREIDQAAREAQSRADGDGGNAQRGMFQ